MKVVSRGRPSKYNFGTFEVDEVRIIEGVPKKIVIAAHSYAHYNNVAFECEKIGDGQVRVKRIERVNIAS